MHLYFSFLLCYNFVETIFSMDRCTHVTKYTVILNFNFSHTILSSLAHNATLSPFCKISVSKMGRLLRGCGVFKFRNMLYEQLSLLNYYYSFKKLNFWYFQFDFKCTFLHYLKVLRGYWHVITLV